MSTLSDLSTLSDYLLPPDVDQKSLGSPRSASKPFGLALADLNCVCNRSLFCSRSAGLDPRRTRRVGVEPRLRCMSFSTLRVTQGTFLSNATRDKIRSVSIVVAPDWTRFPMVARGRVRDGVVVLDSGVRLPEGQEVTVMTHGNASTSLQTEISRSHSVLDIATVSLGSVLGPMTSDDDLLGEMLEGRP